MADMWCQALYFRYPKEIRLDVPGFDYLMTSESKGYYKTGTREPVLEKFQTKLESPEYLQYIFEGTKKRIDEFADFMDRTSTKDRSWEDFIDHVLNLVPWFYIPWYITEYNFLSDRVVSGLERHQDQIKAVTDMNNAAMLLMFPNKEMEFQKEQAEFYALVESTLKGINIFTDPETSRSVENYLQQFGWMKTFVVVPEEPLSKEELEQKIKSAIAERSHETYLQQQLKRNKDQQVTATLMSIIANDTDLVEKIKSAQHLSWLLTWSVEKAMKAFAAGIPWYKEISKTIGVAYEDWVYLTISEVAESLKNKACVVSNEEIQQRKNSFALTINSGVTTLFSGQKASEIVEALNKKAHETDQDMTIVKEIKGKPASPGKAVGTVKIALTAKDAHIVEIGDILVCGMTSPDYVPAMKRAAAIVTDEGGLLCHAAIISRELGKPCVIATKNATRLLTLGDRVEVDADMGIVKII